MPSTSVYSERLGAISDDQFAAAVRKAGLDEFVGAQPVKGGLFGQNVYLSTTRGDYVFRGAPHWFEGGPNDLWQFPKERLYADLLHAGTKVPVAWPQHLDVSCEHFPWPYLIVPRLPGESLSDARLDPEAWNAVAVAMGATLADLHALKAPQACDFDPDTQRLVDFPGGYAAHLAAEVGKWSEEARRHQRFDALDEAWLRRLLDEGAEDVGEATTFVHNDYTLGNVLMRQDGGAWRVSGVVDLMTCCFGDPAADLIRQGCTWLDRAPPVAKAFIDTYRRAGGPARPSPQRLALLVAYERLLIWAYFTRPDVDLPQLRGQTFRDWADGYVGRFGEMLR